MMNFDSLTLKVYHHYFLFVFTYYLHTYCPAVTICFLEIKEPPHKIEGALPLYFRIAAVHGYFEMVVLILPVFESVVHWVFLFVYPESTKQLLTMDELKVYYQYFFFVFNLRRTISMEWQAPK